MINFSEGSRLYHERRADEWTAGQAERLKVSPAVVHDAVKAGHLPSVIEEMLNSLPLGYAPIRDGGIEFTIIGHQPIRKTPPGFG